MDFKDSQMYKNRQIAYSRGYPEYKQKEDSREFVKYSEDEYDRQTLTERFLGLLIKAKEKKKRTIVKCNNIEYKNCKKYEDYVQIK